YSAPARGPRAQRRPDRRPPSSLWPRLFERIAKAADGGDHVRSELLADARDEHLDRVGITVEILVVYMFDQLGAGDDLALVVHQVGKELVLLGGQLDRLAVQRDLSRACVEA